ncbi:uncharacterized protein L199_001422 [Kwoniella botswanensis]|uniref:uncharacterized protein n=1 Tax=Kwoniella botswanensis TaxID=1268659 RepID=UPI00315DDB54
MIVPIIIAALAIRSVFADTYIGCLNSVSSYEVTQTSLSLDGCQSYCSTYTYAYYSNADGTCYCGNTNLAASEFQTAQDSSGTCASDQISAWISSTPFAFQGCSTDTTTGGSSRTSFVSSVPQCFTNCAAYPVISLGRTGSLVLCQCAGEYISTTPATCQGGSSGTSGEYLYVQSLDAEPTGGNARRALKNRRRQIEATKYQYCPSSLTACVIGSDQDTFECVDTQGDLESCGGCMGGLYGPTAHNATSTGVNCSALPNVALGGVTCTRGRCEVSACKYGYALVDNQCVRML